MINISIQDKYVRPSLDAPPREDFLIDVMCAPPDNVGCPIKAGVRFDIEIVPGPLLLATIHRDDAGCPAAVLCVDKETTSIGDRIDARLDSMLRGCPELRDAANAVLNSSIMWVQHFSSTVPYKEYMQDAFSI